jgi:hypothetical protein
VSAKPGSSTTTPQSVVMSALLPSEKTAKTLASNATTKAARRFVTSRRTRQRDAYEVTTNATTLKSPATAASSQVAERRTAKAMAVNAHESAVHPVP